MQFLLILYVLLLTGCMLNFQPASAPSVNPEETADWQTLAPGFEQRTYRLQDDAIGQLEVLRIDPTRYTFRAHYVPGEVKRAREWQAFLAGTAAFVNANFFDVDNRILGLFVADGVVFGTSYQDRGGTFLVQNGQPRIRSNILEPYRGEQLEQAVQAFPMLVIDGESVYQGAPSERISRRTVVAQDRQGRVLLMVTPGFGMTLEALSNYLPTTDMDILTALNLDGGGSTMLYY
ncbi:MAG: phosphodiester glycosidase family protein, partial [Anaerolineae bacterium]|nr:phosphodiester glycosidase family protein [Anaerolineae bacterium]